MSHEIVIAITISTTPCPNGFQSLYVWPELGSVKNPGSLILKESSSLDSIPIKTHLSETEAARFAANKLRFEGVEIKSRLFRRYPKGAFASHLIGHINRINEEDKSD